MLQPFHAIVDWSVLCLEYPRCTHSRSSIVTRSPRSELKETVNVYDGDEPSVTAPSICCLGYTTNRNIYLDQQHTNSQRNGFGIKSNATATKTKREARQAECHQ